MSKPLSQSQKLFNRVARHLLRQNCKSEKDGVCLYRGPNGTRCAAGAVIPNRKYKKSMETCTVDNKQVEPTIISLGYNLQELRALQLIHDQSDVYEWRGNLESYAKERNLKMPVV